MKKPAAKLIRWLLLTATLLTLVLAGCQATTRRTTFTKDDGEEQTTMIFYTKSNADVVDKQVTKLDIDLVKTMGTKNASTLDDGWRIMQQDAKAHAKLRGVKATVSRQQNIVHEVITVDTAKVNFAKLAKLDDQVLAGKTDHIGLANVTQTLKADGYHEVK